MMCWLWVDMVPTLCGALCNRPLKIAERVVEFASKSVHSRDPYRRRTHDQPHRRCFASDKNNRACPIQSRKARHPDAWSPAGWASPRVGYHYLPSSKPTVQRAASISAWE